MASSPLSTAPTSLDDLPLELRWTLTKYLGEKDLGKMRFISSDWNATAKTNLRKRKRLSFNFRNVDKLVQFNDTFVDYEPTDDIAAARFCFNLPALDTTEPLLIFVHQFGHLVTTLSVNLFQGGASTMQNGKWFNATHMRDTVLFHVTLLLQGVKGHVQHLDLTCCAGLQPSVIGHGPFPTLRTLTVGNGHVSAQNGHFQIASLFPEIYEEALILLLSRSIPAIQRFEFQLQTSLGLSNDNPLFLANVLRNLVEVNGQVEVKLDMDLEFVDDEDSALLQELSTVAVRVVDLDIFVRYSFEGMRTALQWIGAQSDWLKKLTFNVKFFDDEAELGGLRIPSLRALEELNYVQQTVESLLDYDSAGYFPNLRKVTTASTGNDFTVALPQVTDLTVDRSRFSDLVRWKQQGIYGAAAFRLPPFSNVENLTCSVKFIDLGSIVELQNLRCFTFVPDDESDKVHSFWKRLAHGAPKLTLQQIIALPETSENEVRKRAEPCFSDLANLKQFKMVIENDYELTIVNLDTLLWLSKTKRLQRLDKLEFEGYNVAAVIPVVYLTELRMYHNSVFVSETNQF